MTFSWSAAFHFHRLNFPCQSEFHQHSAIRLLFHMCVTAFFFSSMNVSVYLRLTMANVLAPPINSFEKIHKQPFRLLQHKQSKIDMSNRLFNCLLSLDKVKEKQNG